jgi:hypothetical protein
MCTEAQLQLPARKKEVNGEMKNKEREGKDREIKKTNRDKRRG